MLVLEPPSMLRLMGSEQRMVQSEAVVVEWIRQSLPAAWGSRRRDASRSPEWRCLLQPEFHEGPTPRGDRDSPARPAAPDLVQLLRP